MRKMRSKMRKMRSKMRKCEAKCENAKQNAKQNAKNAKTHEQNAKNAKTHEQNANSMRRRMSKMRTQCEAKCKDEYPKGTLIYASKTSIVATLFRSKIICTVRIRIGSSY